ncbi:hypothetical protein BT69DRAFT_1330074 [Atractiella rhizophila]|nr:hypothetical protein BT69DRAFT_1330074 [Atractiella rhizophila]
MDSLSEQSIPSSFSSNNLYYPRPSESVASHPSSSIALLDFASSQPQQSSIDPKLLSNLIRELPEDARPTICDPPPETKGERQSAQGGKKRKAASYESEDTVGGEETEEARSPEFNSSTARNGRVLKDTSEPFFFSLSEVRYRMDGSLARVERAQQNRESQRAFRERQAAYVKQLEAKSAHYESIQRRADGLEKKVKELQEREREWEAERERLLEEIERLKALR